MSAAAITLRLAQPCDARALAAMSRDLIETGLGWSYQPERILRLIEHPDVTTLVACERECLAGFAIMSFGEERAHLVLLAVRPAHQRRGVGRRMMAWLLETAATADIVSIHLELRAGNQSARAFYRAIGFAETFRVPGYYRGRESATRMVRVLRRPGTASVAWRPPTLGRG